MHTGIHVIATVIILGILVFATSAANDRTALRRQVAELKETQEQIDVRHAGIVDGLHQELNTRARRINEDVERTKLLIEDKQAAQKALLQAEARVKASDQRWQQLDAVLKICVIRADWKDARVLADRGEFIQEERDADGAIGLLHCSGLWLTTYPPEGANTAGLVRKPKTAAR